MTVILPAPRGSLGTGTGLLWLRDMLRIRRFEETCAQLYSETKIRGFLHLYIGEEAVAVGTMEALTPDDSVVATYREHGQALLRGIPMKVILAEFYGRAEGCCRGRGGSMHLFDRTRRFFGGNGIVAAGLPVAVGLALAERMQSGGPGRVGGPGQVGAPGHVGDNVVACYFGDGAVAEGEFHESVNLAALWRLPVVFFCENNQYAMGTALARSHSQTNLAIKAASYEVPAWQVDGMDVEAVVSAAARAVEAVRNGAGPHFLELLTYRFRAHSMYDPDRYRDKGEIERWRARDPISILADRLREAGALDDAGMRGIEDDVAAEIAAAVAFAEAGQPEPVADLTRFVTSEGGQP